MSCDFKTELLFKVLVIGDYGVGMFVTVVFFVATLKYFDEKRI